MFRSKTLLILGAGSSKEAQLPTGIELKKIIAEKLNFQWDDEGNRERSGSQNIYNAFLSKGNRQSEYFKASTKLREALALGVSIDNVLHNHSGDEVVEFCGKLGIIESIWEAEYKSLFNKHNNLKLNFWDHEKTWFVEFIKILTEKIHVKELNDIFKNIAIINFNYDRCIEHFLYEALQSSYGVNEQDAANILSSLQIFHPYGLVGKLPWQEVGSERKIPFGPKSINFQAISSSAIKTFNESLQDSADLASIRNLVQSSETIIFLGFAFHKENMDLLSPKKSCNTKRVFATALNSSESNREETRSDIHNLLNRKPGSFRVEIRDLACGDLFREYRQSLISAS